MTDAQWKEFIEEGRKLSALFARPEPGLITWVMAVAKQLEKVGAFCGLVPKL